jgi:hypothetical protein
MLLGLESGEWRVEAIAQRPEERRETERRQREERGMWNVECGGWADN